MADPLKSHHYGSRSAAPIVHSTGETGGRGSTGGTCFVTPEKNQDLPELTRPATMGRAQEEARPRPQT